MPLTTYAGESSRAYLADLCAGLALLGLGLLPVTERRMRRIGLLALAAGVVWFAPDWDGWDRGPVLVRSLRALPIPLFVAVVAGYIAAGTVSVGARLVPGPLPRPYCWRNCIDNSLSVSAHPGSHERCTTHGGETRRVGARSVAALTSGVIAHALGERLRFDPNERSLGSSRFHHLRSPRQLIVGF
jgi:hypothetical protein